MATARGRPARGSTRHDTLEGGQPPREGPSARKPTRPFNGFDRERAVYERIRPALLERAEGKFIVIVGDQIEGPLETFEDALRAGYRRFGLGPLYVKQVTAAEPVFAVSREVAPCRS